MKLDVAGASLEDFFAPGARPSGVYVSPPCTVFDRAREDGGRARAWVASGFLVLDRIGPDGKVIAAQKFPAAELDALGDAVAQARRYLLGVPDAKADPVLNPEAKKGRRR